MAEKTYRIHGMDVQNFQKIKVVSIAPGGGVVQITGKNGNGKSSLLAAIGAAIEGEGVIKFEPIRRGQDWALIRLDLGDVKITRKFTRATAEQNEKTGKTYVSSVVVESTEGARWPSPQKMLDSLYGALAFDPMEFIRMAGKDQFDLLKTFVPGFDFAAADRVIAGLKAKRTDIGRDMKTARARADGVTVPADAPAERVDETAVINAMQEASATNTQIEVKRGGINSRKTTAHGLRNRIQEREIAVADMRRQADELEALAKQELASVQQMEIEIEADEKALPASISIDGLRENLLSVQRANRMFDIRENKTQLNEAAKDLEKDYADLTTQIEAKEQNKRDTVAAAKMPVEGLTFGNETVLYNELPLDQSSGRDQIIISARIAAAKSPRLRVMRIANGNDIDEDGMKVLEEFAAAEDMQIIVERIIGAAGVAFELVDGHLKDGPEEPTPPEEKPSKAKKAAAAPEQDDFASDKKLI